MVEQTAADYSKILKSGTDLEREIKPLCTNIEDMLARLDEFETLLANARAETNGIMEQHVCGIINFSDKFQQLQKSIDHLEKFIEIVSENVDQVERSVDIAEEELHVTDYSFKGLVLKPLLAKARLNNSSGNADAADSIQTRTNLRDEAFEPVPIFKTDDYFKVQDATTGDGDGDSQSLLP